MCCEREEGLGGFFRYEGEVDVFWGEGPLVGTAELEQCFGKADRSGVNGVETIDKFAVPTARVVAGDVEQRLRDRQRREQFVRGGGCESLLFDCESPACGDACFGPGRHDD